MSIFREHYIEFQSTPSVRRETTQCCLIAALVEISIHSLREEGDGEPFRLGG